MEQESFYINRTDWGENMELEARTAWVWRETLKVHLRAPETRLASSLSPIEIFVSLYYGGILKFDPKHPLSDARDRIIVSKGHGSICLYPILADLGFFPKEELGRVGQSGGILGGIPDPIIPGYETVNGSLGHGVGVATGVALALKRKDTSQSVFVITGDGELHEGANWEAFMFASHHNLDNLNMVVDNNHICMLGHTETVVSHESLAARLIAFGWDCDEVDGHDVHAVAFSLNAMKNKSLGKPKALIAHTIKGRGVPGLEDASLSHILNPKPDLLQTLLGERREVL
jgi:transketolase